ncbi:glycosyltransferase, partial [Helicobacter pylori]
MLKVSVITACFNSEKTIEDTILSVLNQTYKNIEYIIIDGSSADGTLEIIQKYRDKIACV